MIEKNMVERVTGSGLQFVPNRDNSQFGKGQMIGRKNPIPSNKKNYVGKPTSNAMGVYWVCGRKHGNLPYPSLIVTYFGCGQQGH